MTNYRSFIYLTIIFLYVLFFAYNIPHFSNDYRYMLIEGTDDRVTSVADIILSQYRHYFTWGGRTPPHVLAQLLLLSGKLAGALATALCFVLLIYLVNVLAKGSLLNPFKIDSTALLISFSLLYFCLRNFGEVLFMLVTSCNYLFTTTFVLLILMPFVKALECNNDDCTKSKGFVLKNIFIALMFLCGLTAGWCNENTGFALCSMTFLYLVYMFRQKKLSSFMIAGFLGMCTGFLILVLSPGNAARMQMMESTGRFDYFSHIFTAIGVFNLSLLENLPLIIAFLYLLFKVYKKGLIKKYRQSMLCTLYLFAIGFASLSVMIFSPNFPARSATVFTVFTLVATLKLYYILKKEQVTVVNRSFFYSYSVIFSLYFLITATNSLECLSRLNDEFYQRENSIKEQILDGKTDLVVKPFSVVSSRYIFVGDIHADSNYFANKILSRYYKISSIVRTCDEIKTLPHSDLLIIQSKTVFKCKAN
ncbi:DUF6056 family protein [Succinivibrio sp.]|uniref:DUF3329 domain-containing protein n=1 Tax=Succinivibrio sp. TaxID=2053619 RepID=UPI0038638D74